MAQAQNNRLISLHERRNDACMAEEASNSVSCVNDKADYTTPDKTSVQTVKYSRRKGRRIRREAKRLNRRIARSQSLGGVDKVFSYHDLYKAGKQSCRNVRWKQSTQNFEAHLFSGTAKRRKEVVTGNYKFSPYSHFMLKERGKIRPIDAPRIQDRQVEKVYTQKVLLPLYQPFMIYNNGASLPNKGFMFSRKELEKDLHEHFRKYGRTGGILLVDGKKFFPSANHAKIYERHNQFIFDDALKYFGDGVVQTVTCGYGMPLGVEPSQAEMIAYPSKLDNYMKCQVGLKEFGHYMDDFYAIIPPDVDYRDVLKTMREKASECGFAFSDGKTKYVPFAKPFRYCKAKYTVTETGKVIVFSNKKTASRDKRKLIAFQKMLAHGEITYEDLWASVNGMMAYLDSYNEHNKVLKLRRMFYCLFGFSCEKIEGFKNAVCSNQAV